MKLSDRRAMAFIVENMSLRMLVFSGRKIESWHSVSLGPNMVREGLIVTPEVMGGVMAEALQENDIPGKGVVSAVPSTGSTGQTLTIPSVKKGNFKEMVRREIKRAMPATQNGDLVNWQLLPGNQVKNRQVYALAVPRSNIVNMMEACTIGGMTIKGIELKPFALARAVNCKSGIIVQAEVDNIEIVVIDKAFPALFRSIPVKDATPTPEVASQHLMRELPFTIDYYNRTYADSQLGPEAVIYLCGELGLDSALSMEIAQSTEREVVGVEPPVEYPPNFPVEQYLTNLGLMLRETW